MVAWKTLDTALRVKPGHAPKLDAALAVDDRFFPDKDDAQKSLKTDAQAINDLQDKLFAEGKRALLVVLQGMDTSGKDGTVRGVFNDTGPLGVCVHAFGKPTAHELAHDYLWRVHHAVPGRGMIGIFNRSHYEDVLVVKVRGWVSDDVIEQRYTQINAFEKHLAENDVTILKFMLHISKDEQRERLQSRLDDPLKRWKFNPGDLEDRKCWDDFMAAYETALAKCSTRHAPWRVIPADKKWRRDAIIARIVRGTLEEMDPRPRSVDWDPGQYKIV